MQFASPCGRRAGLGLLSLAGAAVFFALFHDLASLGAAAAKLYRSLAGGSWTDLLPFFVLAGTAQGPFPFSGPRQPRILVIRRDNIGDLVCTTPMVHALRQANPGAWIGVLANSYNVAVLHGNPDIDEVFAYRKAKHREPGESRWAVWLQTAGLLWKLRRRRVDVAIVASPGGERYARLIGARRIVADKPVGKMHEVERCALMLKELGVEVLPGPLYVKADQGLASQLASRAGLGERDGRYVAVHISARRPKQRWPVAAFVRLIEEMLDSGAASKILLFWSPGAEDDPAHPGDDAKLAAIVEALPGRPVFPIRTAALAELMAGLSLCDATICSDGGAMHVAAGLGKPIVSLFGDSDISRWRPWGVPHTVLQPESREVRDVAPADVLSAFRRLLGERPPVPDEP